MANIDWEERTFQLASSILVSHINDIDIETAIEVAQNFKEKYIEKMALTSLRRKRRERRKTNLLKIMMILWRRYILYILQNVPKEALLLAKARRIRIE